MLTSHVNSLLFISRLIHMMRTETMSYSYFPFHSHFSPNWLLLSILWRRFSMRMAGRKEAENGARRCYWPTEWWGALSKQDSGSPSPTGECLVFYKQGSFLLSHVVRSLGTPFVFGNSFVTQACLIRRSLQVWIRMGYAEFFVLLGLVSFST